MGVENSLSYLINPGYQPLVQPELPLTPRVAPVSVPAPQMPYVMPGGNLTLPEFSAGGASPRVYPTFDPVGGANLRTAGQAMGQAYQAGYTPGQYGGVSMGIRPALPPPSEMPLAIRPSAAPATVPFEPVGAPPMKPAQVLNVRTIPGTGGAAADAIPMLEAGGAKAAGVGSKLATVGSVGAKALPLVGDVLQGYANSEGSWGRGISAGLGSLAGRLAGGAAGTATAPVTGPVGPIVGEIGGSFAGAAGGAKLYDMLTGADSYVNPDAVRRAEENASMRAVPSNMTMGALANGSLSANTRGSAPSMNLEYAVDPATKQVVTTVPPKIERGGPTEVPSAAISPATVKPAAPKPAAPAKPAGFQPPTQEELVRFRRETGTAFSPQSINDKLSIERMRAGEETFDTKQANAYRKANPNYRPGQYVKGYNPNAQPAATARPALAPRPAVTPARPPTAPRTSVYPSLEQRGLARTVGAYDPVTGVTTRNSDRPTKAQQGDALRNAYYARYRASR